MPGYGAMYWAERTAAARRRSYPKIKGAHTADVVVIGAGLTGASAAYVLAAGGLDVVVLDAGRVASASTAGSLGAIVPEPDASFREAEALAGRRPAKAMWQAAQKGAAEMAATLKKLNIRCDLAAAPYLVNARPARATDDLEWLRRERAARKSAGLVSPGLAGAAVVAETALESAGALKMTGASTCDPVRAALGLVAAAEAQGARVFERSAVRRTTFTRKDADVVLADARIRTKGIVVATGEPGVVFRQLRRHVRRETGYVVVTEPLPAAMRREVGRRAAIATEASSAGRPWLRWLADDRALFAGARSPLAPPRQRDRLLRQHTAELMYELSLRYPVISGLPARWGWDVDVVSTADTLPWIGPHRNYPFHFFAMGFGWHGDALAWAAARAALRYFRGEATSDDGQLGFGRYL